MGRPFQIASNPATMMREWTSPLWLAPSGVVGVLRKGEAVTFETEADAADALAALPEQTRRFYSLAVVGGHLPTPWGL